MPNDRIEAALQIGSAFVNRCVVRETIEYHAHNFVEIAFIAEGSGTHLVGGSEYRVSGGDVFLINYDVPHGFSPENGPLVVYNCIFTPAYFSAALGESRNFFDITDHFLLSNLYANLPTDYLFVTANGSEQNRILNIYERMLHEFQEKQLGYRDLMRGYVIELLVIICRLKLCVDSDKTQKMLGILEHVNAHYHESIRVETLASIAGYSVSHFRRLFYSLTGKSLSRYVQTLRVEEAYKLLKDHTLNVEEVARRVGYSDMKHFYAVFRRISGHLPRDFR